MRHALENRSIRDGRQSFGRDTGFGIGLAFLPFIFAPILGFGSDAYRGPAAGRAVTA